MTEKNDKQVFGRFLRTKNDQKNRPRDPDKVDAKGFMCIDKDAGINEKGATHYSERLSATIFAESMLTIEVGDKYTAKYGKVSRTGITGSVLLIIFLG